MCAAGLRWRAAIAAESFRGTMQADSISPGLISVKMTEAGY
jgi:hypothetical protein